MSRVQQIFELSSELSQERGLLSTPPKRRSIVEPDGGKAPRKISKMNDAVRARQLERVCVRLFE